MCTISDNTALLVSQNAPGINQPLWLSQTGMSLNPWNCCLSQKYQSTTAPTKPSVLCLWFKHTRLRQTYFQLTWMTFFIGEMCSIKLVFLFWIKTEEIIHTRLHPSALTYADHCRSPVKTYTHTHDRRRGRQNSGLVTYKAEKLRVRTEAFVMSIKQACIFLRGSSRRVSIFFVQTWNKLPLHLQEKTDVKK